MTGLGSRGLAESHFQFLRRDDIQKIHLASLEVLQHTGVQVFDEELLEVFEKAGCELDKKKNTAKIPQYLVKETISKAPSIVTLCGRDKRSDVRLGDGKIHSLAQGGCAKILDLETGERRKSVKEDLRNTTRLADALPNTHVMMAGLVFPVDVDARLVDLHMIQASFENTEKHLYVCCNNDELLDKAIGMAIAVAGGEEELRKRPLISCLQQPAAPLMQTKTQAKVLRNYAEKGLPIMIDTHPIAGLTGPASLAGELVVANAEALSSLVAAQLINPKTPIIYGTVASTPNMRNGINLQGSVECGLLGAGFVQLAKFYGLPSAATSGTDSRIPDAQAAIERIITTMPIVLAGADLIHHLAIDTEETFSYEQMVIDDEIMAMIERVLAGIKVDDETLAIDLIHEVGPGEAFLSKLHTLQHFEKEHYIPKLANRTALETWEKAGSKDLRERARDEALKILREHNPSPLDQSTKDKLREILREAERKL